MGKNKNKREFTEGYHSNKKNRHLRCLIKNQHITSQITRSHIQISKCRTIFQWRFGTVRSKPITLCLSTAKQNYWYAFTNFLLLKLPIKVIITEVNLLVLCFNVHMEMCFKTPADHSLEVRLVQRSLKEKQADMIPKSPSQLMPCQLIADETKLWLCMSVPSEVHTLAYQSLPKFLKSR